MKFKEKLQAHVAGKYDFVNEFMELALSGREVKTEVQKNYITYGTDYELGVWQPKYSVKEDKPEHYIAIKVRTILERHAKRALKLKAGHETDDEIIDIFYEGLLGVDLHYTVDQADKITQQEVDRVVDYLGYWESEDWQGIYEHYKNIAIKVNKEKQKYYDEIVPLIQNALNEAIELVDVNLSNKEIVRYVSQVTLGKTYKKLNELLGSRLFRISNQKYYISKFNLSVFEAYEILEIHQEKKFTKSQQEFIEKIVDLVQVELDSNNNKPFTLNKTGEPIDINKRYFAQKIGLEESAFKKRLERVQNRWRLNTKKTI